MDVSSLFEKPKNFNKKFHPTGIDFLIQKDLAYVAVSTVCGRCFSQNIYKKNCKDKMREFYSRCALTFNRIFKKSIEIKNSIKDGGVTQHSQ